MRLLKLAVISLLIFFLLFTCIGLLMPSSVTVGRSENINASIDKIRFYTGDISHWKYWMSNSDTSFFKQLTPYTNIKNSKIILNGYTITLIKNDVTNIISVWQKQGGAKQTGSIQLQYNNQENITTVNWNFKQQLSWYPWERLSAMLHDKILGPSMEAGLLKLKLLVEKDNEM